MRDEYVMLWFSVGEKRVFLERHGYEVVRMPITREVNIYQNKFQTVHSVDTVAIKGDEQVELHEMFERLVRRKILEL